MSLTTHRGEPAGRPGSSREVPGPRGRWLVGQIPPYERDKLGWLTRNRAAYGDLVRLSRQAVVLFDGELAQDVLAQTNDAFFLDDGALGSGREQAAQRARLPAWMRRRKLATRSAAKSLSPESIDRMVALLQEEFRARAGTTGDLFYTSAEVCAAATVRYCLAGLAEPAELAAVTEASMIAFRRTLQVLVDREPRVRWLPRPAGKRAAQANRDLYALLRAQVARRRTNPAAEGPRDLLDEIVSATEDDDDAVAALRLIVFTAAGPPGAAMSWLLKRLAEHPRLAEEIAREAAAVRLGAAIHERRLPAATAFLQEVLRLHPPQWLLSRTTAGPVKVGDYDLPPGTEVLICSYLIHRDERWWAEPAAFLPGRWDEPHQRHAFLPFGGGPRTCPGSPLAKVQLLAATALVARDHTITVTEPGETTFEGLLLSTGLRGTLR